MLCELHPNINKKRSMFQEKQNKTMAYFKQVKTLDATLFGSKVFVDD